MKRCLTVLMIIASLFMISIPEALAESYPKACIAADKNDSCRSHNGITVYDAYYGGTNYVLHREDWIEKVGVDYFYNMLNLAEKEGKLEIRRMADDCVSKVLIIP